jgi:hypothetical protein
LRAFQYHARGCVAERKMRFDQAVADVQTARLAYRGISTSPKIVSFPIITLTNEVRQVTR